MVGGKWYSSLDNNGLHQMRGLNCLQLCLPEHSTKPSVTVNMSTWNQKINCPKEGTDHLSPLIVYMYTMF